MSEPKLHHRNCFTNLYCFCCHAVGVKLLVDNGTLLAQAAGVPEAVIGLTPVALGTSLPELITVICVLNYCYQKGKEDFTKICMNHHQPEKHDLGKYKVLLSLRQRRRSKRKPLIQRTRKAIRLIVSFYIFDSLLQYSRKYPLEYWSKLSNGKSKVSLFPLFENKSLGNAEKLKKCLHLVRIWRLCRGPPDCQ